ncbi:hypothetical protein ACFU6K_38950 [Kitasatospora sp. NPDC057512]|uniref:hypothetical protein n=1 Tax=Kitasatospora sp. NPDC057512 TaxID=3346154 RepID=UPI0036AAE2AD
MASKGATSAPVVRPVFAESSKQVILRTAKENGTAPAGDRFTLVEYDGGYGPELIWQAERTGGLCAASESVTAGWCETVEETSGRRVPSVGVFMDPGLRERDGEASWVVRVMASGETIDGLSCQGRDFPVRQVYVVDLAGARRTVYTASIPRNLQGEYRVSVRRDGKPGEERLDLGFEKGRVVQC